MEYRYGNHTIFQKAQTPWAMLAELESTRLDGATRPTELLQERTGSSLSCGRNDLVRPINDEALADRLLTACNGDTTLRDRIKPFTHLVRNNPWDYPLVYHTSVFIVTVGSDRRESQYPRRHQHYQQPMEHCANGKIER